MKNFALLFLLIFAVAKIQAQNYQIAFAGTGANTVVDSVKVENLTQCTDTTLRGSDLLHLTGTVGISELNTNSNNTIRIYPNPSTGICTVGFEATTQSVATIGLYDITGKRILLMQELLTMGHHTYSLSGIHRGIYLLKVESDKYSYTAKIISSNDQSGVTEIIHSGTTPGIDKQSIGSNTNKIENLKSGKSLINMQYTSGDILKMTGFSGKIYRTIFMLIPTQSQTVTFNFVACTDADGNNYPIVQIGTQTWMAENLKTTKYNDSTSIPNVADYLAWRNLTTPSYCWYDNNSTFKNTHGALYNMYAVKTGTLCPKGWHVPSDEEWTTLTTYLGGVSASGGKMKTIKCDETAIGFWNNPNTGATNESGFSALPSGIRDQVGFFGGFGQSSDWWSATNYSTTEGWHRYIYYNNKQINRGSSYFAYGFSIRGIRDSSTTAFPALTTSIITNITQTTATSGGNVTSVGGANVTARGVCWNTSQNPTISDSHTTDGNGTGVFVSNITGLSCKTKYYVRAYATNSIGTAYGNELNFTTTASGLLPTVTTSLVTNIAKTSVTCGGNVTSDGGNAVTARGVCWSTSTNLSIADSHTIDGSGTGLFVSLPNGLSGNTIYYIRAYATNCVGTSYGSTYSFKTLYPCPGMETITINHVDSGGVAPVNKTVTYGTFTDLPGEPSKCWITSNLGADHQATAKNDATEASAGWYWQFNRKQGYKHDGTIRTPNTTWIINISENSDWTSANDPCSHELGSGWRIPTINEWSNVLTSGAWANWWLPWESGLKLHVAGELWQMNGNLENRGGLGMYWSSTHAYNYSSYNLRFQESTCYAYGNEGKSMGLTLRCIRDSASSITMATLTTAVVSNITQTTATGGGNVTSDGGATVTARGLCWGTSPNPTTANSKTNDGSGTGTFVSSLASLAPNTPYYVRAYAINSIGTVYGNEVSFTTLAGSSCGSTITINHVAGAVAPVTKTVTYGTVTNIPGETSKCWITSNLGASQQATAVSDATEASAGWYWQFNRKQGYKHDGTTRTPNSAWISSISETSDWITANDPCTIELGSGWRIPTSTEWTNVDAGGSWTNWNGPWNSALKMNTAGYLDYSNGLLSSRGSNGSFWSNTQGSVANGWNINFTSGYINVSSVNNKAYGVSLRCIKDTGVSTAIPTVITTTVTSITQTTATSGGNVTSDGGATVTVRGVCWGISPNPTTANSKTTDGSGTGTFVSSLASLAQNTPYYVRAYATNSVGTSYGNEVSFTTLSGSTCGSPITINHVAGAVAPVTKTVTYGTVTNIPGETSKCWITSNLGASQQATAVSDATEASAGWYWQFNRKQGYKHDVTTRTPNFAWTTSISENSDWVTANDPCTIELGSGWRIPSSTEWTNVNTSGSWTNWNAPWNSALKMHAAGYLDYSNGLLSSRGSNGSFWSNTQGSAANSWNINFTSGYINVSSVNNKAYSVSIRCIKDTGVSTAIPIVTTTAVTSITQTTATGGGNVTSDGGATVTARGVCWNTSPNPTTANSKTTDGSDTGTFVSNLASLAQNTPYYARAYATNSVGTAYGNEVSFTTLPGGSTCGSPIIINHVAGTVAPITKTVTYGTVTNIPGETSKCWITSNLGASQQATAVSDATEASAGWYWQFNRKQGYKHDGTTRTPNTTWITSINENSDWVATNDPCTIELGSGWRIPTSTEWTNVDANGNWTNSNGPWNSALKLHAAGYLNTTGLLEYRGTYGYYLNSTQLDNSDGWILGFSSSNCQLYNGNKANGWATRCIRDAGSSSTTPNVTTNVVTSITQTTATSGGNVTSDGGATVTVRGVCWGTSPNPTTANSKTTDGSGIGTFVSNLTSLSPNTPYYVRAYATNSIGTAYGNEVNFTTLSGSTCGSPITINHVAGIVAPVTKTVNYGTVTNIPGETSKCWITSNLGASQQATTVSDATEASAGWYWQFNRKQGYKHDGTSRTPNSTWITPINENLDWQAANDPCLIELGSGWRIPTQTEWTNVNTSGSWANWNGPWNSALKIHAAGDLYYGDGYISGRGTRGYYWSSSQDSDYGYGRNLNFSSSYSLMGPNYKATGVSMRCIK